MGIIERIQNEMKRMAFEEGVEKGIAKGKLEGKLEGTQEGAKAGIILGKIQSLAALRGTSFFFESSNEDLAITFQLPLAWVERIRKGDVPGNNEVEKFISSQNRH